MFGRDLASSEDGGFDHMQHFRDILYTLIFFTAIFFSGKVCSRVLGLPALVCFLFRRFFILFRHSITHTHKTGRRNYSRNTSRSKLCWFCSVLLSVETVRWDRFESSSHRSGIAHRYRDFGTRGSSLSLGWCDRFDRTSSNDVRCGSCDGSEYEGSFWCRSVSDFHEYGYRS